MIKVEARAAPLSEGKHDTNRFVLYRNARDAINRFGLYTVGQYHTLL